MCEDVLECPSAGSIRLPAFMVSAFTDAHRIQMTLSFLSFASLRSESGIQNVMKKKRDGGGESRDVVFKTHVSPMFQYNKQIQTQIYATPVWCLPLRSFICMHVLVCLCVCVCVCLSMC